MLGRSKSANTSSWLVDLSSSIFLFNAKGTVVYNAVYRLLIALSVPKISALKFKVVLNRAEFWTFFALPNFKGAVPPKVVHR